MPPLPEDESMSESGGEAIPYRKGGKKEAAPIEVDDEEDGEEDEYVVEKILSHDWDKKTGTVIYEVKWEGYSAKEDRTWEPEDNLESAPDALAAYHKKNGRPEPVQVSSKKGSKKRKTEDVITPRSTNKEKRHKPETPEPSLKKKRPSKTSFPKGTWEGLVATVDTIEESRDESGELVRYVFIIWEDGDKTRHPVATVNEKCPQAMLRYYESHLVFRTPEMDANGDVTF